MSVTEYCIVVITGIVVFLAWRVYHATQAREDIDRYLRSHR